jgi:uncharacterized membrane protein
MRSPAARLPVAARARSTLSSQPAYAALVQFPAVCFTGTLVSDIAYWHTTVFLWSTFSSWLLVAGCLTGVVAGTAAAATWLRVPQVRTAPFAVFHALLLSAAFALAVANTVVHSREGHTAVVPLGLTLSGAVVVLMLLATWFGWPRDDAGGGR